MTAAADVMEDDVEELSAFDMMASQVTSGRFSKSDIKFAHSMDEAKYEGIRNILRKVVKVRNDDHRE